MDCCATEAVVDDLCPACHEKGRAVKPVTIRAMAPDAQPSSEGWRFCRSAHCGVAYYHVRGNTVPVSALPVRVGLKETAPDRPVCYCFAYSEQDIARDPNGVSEDIKARCRRGEDRCAETNPQGSCCLGNVLAIARALLVST